MAVDKRTYPTWLNGEVKSVQKEYTEPTRLLDDEGNLLAPGFARHMVFDYDRSQVVPKMRSKEWDFYQISNGKYAVQLNFANISFGGFISAKLIDLHNKQHDRKLDTNTVCDATVLYVGGREKYKMPPKGDVPNNLKYTVENFLGKAEFEFDTKETSRTLYFKGKAKGEDVICDFHMDIPEGLENITTVLPFKNMKSGFFMTTKQNCMPCSGTFKFGDKVVEFSKEDTFCALDWGRVNTPYQLVWYWGNGAQKVKDADGTEHTVGFEITWCIGDESFATETAIFYDGKLHKFGAVDVEKFPKTNGFMNEWKFVSEDGRFDMTMTPFFDNHSDTNVLNLLRMHTHQLHGIWNGTLTLDDGKKIEIKDMYAFCEYCENKW